MNNFSAYQSRFHMPVINRNLWYAFTVGLVRYITIDTESDFDNAPDLAGGEDGKLNAGNQAGYGAQLSWLQRELQSVNRTITPWVVLTGHRPFYTAKGSCEPCRAAFEQIMIDNRVDLALFGHKHHYMRSYPVANNIITQTNYTNPTAPVYIVTGAAGHMDGLDTDALPVTNYSAVTQQGSRGWGKLYVASPYSLIWRYFRSDNYSIIDEFAITKVNPTGNDRTPYQIRTAYVPNGMTISWNTRQPLLPSVVPTVYFGTSPSTMTQVATGTSVSYEPFVNYYHHVILTNLIPNTQYYYTVNFYQQPQSSLLLPANTLLFTSAISAGDISPFSVGIVGDLGLYDSDTTVVTMQLVTQQMRFWMHTGDIAYSDYFYEMPIKQSYDTAYDSFLDQMIPVFKQTPYMVLPGSQYRNHQFSC